MLMRAARKFVVRDKTSCGNAIGTYMFAFDYTIDGGLRWRACSLLATCGGEPAIVGAPRERLGWILENKKQ